MIKLTQELEIAVRLAIQNAAACPMHFKNPSSKAVQHVEYCESCEDIILARVIEAMNHGSEHR